MLVLDMDNWGQPPSCSFSLDCVGWRSFVLFSKDESVGFPFRNNGHSSSPTSLCVPDSEQYYFVVVVFVVVTAAAPSRAPREHKASLALVSCRWVMILQE